MKNVHVVFLICATLLIILSSICILKTYSVEKRKENFQCSKDPTKPGFCMKDLGLWAEENGMKMNNWCQNRQNQNLEMNVGQHCVAECNKPGEPRKQGGRLIKNNSNGYDWERSPDDLLTDYIPDTKMEYCGNGIQTKYIDRISLQNLDITTNNIGTGKININNKEYDTTDVGRVQMDSNGVKYLEMNEGMLTLPEYASNENLINHTFHFVVRAENMDGIINRITKAHNGNDNFNLHMNHNGNFTALYPIKWSDDKDGMEKYTISSDSSGSFDPGDSYVIIVLKIKFVSPGIYDGRIQFVSKPDSQFIVSGTDTEVLNMTLGLNQLARGFNIGHNDAESDNFKLYEYGVIDEYVDESKFEELVENLKNKYYPS